MKRLKSSAGTKAEWTAQLDRRPIVAAIAGPNGAGKSTFFAAHLASCGLPFLNADALARELDMDAYEAAQTITAIRTEWVAQRESFIFETVFSDPVGDKLNFLSQAAHAGHAVVLCFIGVSNSDVSEQRVAMRVTQGGHDVPTDKLIARFPRTLANLRTALKELPLVLLFDNDDLRTPYRHFATYTNGHRSYWNEPIPSWFGSVAKDGNE